MTQASPEARAMVERHCADLFASPVYELARLALDNPRASEQSKRDALRSVFLMGFMAGQTEISNLARKHGIVPKETT